jgi:hypothetical protein
MPTVGLRDFAWVELSEVSPDTKVSTTLELFSTTTELIPGWGSGQFGLGMGHVTSLSATLSEGVVSRAHF